MAEFKYWAFLSYSHQDRKWGDWLHKALETYRFPRRLIGKEARDGKVPERVYPIFRDQEELSASADLGSKINEALRESRYLIVICSPHAAQSRWVSQEIIEFKKLEREDRILALIVAGEPNASDGKSGFVPEDECFPKPMRYRLAANGELSTQPVEPLAADVREGKDEKDNAKLKLLAGLLGVNYDDLRQREHERRLRRARAIGLGAILLTGLFAGLASWAIIAAQREAAQKRETQRLLVASDTNRAEELFSKDDSSSALVFLARAVQQDPDSHSAAADRLWFALTERSWPLPLSSPMRHSGKILSAYFSPDGGKVVTASQDTARVWDAASGDELCRLNHPRLIRQAIFTSGGRDVLTICSDGIARLWNVTSGEMIPHWRVQHDTEINSVAVDSKSQYVATGSADGTVCVWNMADATPVAERQYPDRQNVHILAFDPSDETLLLSVSGNTATLFKLPEGRVVSELHHEAALNSAEFNPKGDRVVTSDEDGKCWLWDVSTGNEIELKHDAEVTSAIFSPNGELVATLAGLQLCLWQIGETPICKRKLDHDTEVRHARFSPDSLVILTGTNEGRVQTWNVATGKPVGEPIREDGDPILDLDSQGERLLVATAKGTARVWRPAPRYPISNRLVHSAEVISISPDGRLLLTTSADNTACLSDLARREVSPKRFHDGEVLCSAFSADGNYVATGNADGTARLWLTSSGQPFGQPLRPGGPVARIAFSPDGKLLATATDDGVAQFWDLGSFGENGKPMTHAPSITSIEFKADSKLFLTVGTDSKVQCWRVGTGEPMRTLLSDQADFTCARFSPNKDLIATGSSSGTAQIWPLTSGNPIYLPFYDYRAVTDVCFSPDGHYLAIASETGQVMIWDVAMSRPVGTPMHPALPVSVVRFSPDSSKIATACKDGTVQLWDTTTGRVLSEQLHQLRAVGCLAFSLDSSTLFSGSDDGTVQAYDIKTGLTSADRESLATFSRAISSVTLLDSGITEPHVVEKLDRLQATAKSFSAGTRALTDWFFSEPAQRPLTPFSGINLSAYLYCRDRGDSDASTYEMLYYSAGNLASPKQSKANLPRFP
jgi:WD40 repeat protein